MRKRIDYIIDSIYFILPMVVQYSICLTSIYMINSSWRCTLTLEINANIKIATFLRSTRLTYEQTYYTDTESIWPRGLRLHALHAIRAAHMIAKKRCRQPDRETEIWIYGRTYGHIYGWKNVRTDVQTYENVWMEGRTYKLNWTALGG